MDPIRSISESSMLPATSPNGRPRSRSDRNAPTRWLAHSFSWWWQLPAPEVWRSPCTGPSTRSLVPKRRPRRSRRTMGRNPICTVLSVLIGMVILGTAWPVVSPAAAASSGGGHDSTPAVAGGGTHEIVPDPRRPLIYQVGVGDSLFYLNASTGEYLDSVIVGPSATSIDLSADGNFLYVAVSGANQTVLVDIDARAVVRTTSLDFSPLSVRHGRPGRLYISEKGEGTVRVVNETTGAVISSFALVANVEGLLDVSPDGTELLVHLRSSPVWLLQYSVVTDDPVLIASDSQSQGDPEELVVDWPARVIYFGSFVPYGIELISLDTLLRTGDFRTDAYPACVALLSVHHLVFGLSSYPYGSALWAFNISNGSLARQVPMGTTELSF